MAGNVRHSGFESRAYGRERRKYTVRYFSRPYRRNGSRKADNGGSMLAKMGICALLAGLVLLSEFIGGREGIVEASSDLSRANDDSIGGDYLGKLRFVELPGIIQVFSSDAKLRVGVEYKSWQLNEDKTIITVSGIEGKALPAPSDGTIKTVTGEDDEKRIELATDGDIVISYTAAGETAIEEGQPVKAGDTLFKSADSLSIGISKGGRPMVPTEYFDMADLKLS